MAWLSRVDLSVTEEQVGQLLHVAGLEKVVFRMLSKLYDDDDDDVGEEGMLNIQAHLPGLGWMVWGLDVAKFWYGFQALFVCCCLQTSVQLMQF